MSEFLSKIPRRNFLFWSLLGTGMLAGSAARAQSPSNPEKQQGALEESEILSIERACKRLCINYGRTIDERRIDEFALLFADKVKVVLGGETFETRDAFVKRIRERPTERTSAHLCTNILIDVIDRNNAKGICYITLFRANCETHGNVQAKELFPRMVGRYEDHYQKSGGVWQIKERTLHPIMAVEADMIDVCP